jgi:type I restriction-modification system DNA methylase subunit
MREQSEWAEFVKAFNAIARHRHRYEVFRDFVTMSAISLHNAVRKVESLEAEYMSIVQRYKKEEALEIAGLLGILVSLLEASPRDVLGQLYMALELGNSSTGQFFTPEHISEFMAQIVYDENLATLDKPFITVCEPACGAGGMVLAFVKVMLSHGHNPAKRVWVQAQDIDRTAALMCYVQLALWNIPARIVVGNTLAMEEREVFYTPAHYLYFWESRLRRQQAQSENGQQAESQNEPRLEDAQDVVVLAQATPVPPVSAAPVKPKPTIVFGGKSTQTQIDFDF